MANDAQTYQNLVTSQYQNQPNFMATIALDVGMSVQVQFLLEQMLTVIFDLDTPPVGDQLDIIGAWVGVSRDVVVPITDVFFTWDSSNLALGWDKGTWGVSSNATQLLALPDDAYLLLIRAKIAANSWNGTTTTAYAIYEALFPDFIILIQDDCDMHYRVAVIGGIVPALTLAILAANLVPLKPEGIGVEYLTSVDTNPAFCWDMETTNCKGWNQGSWLEVVSTS
jgi:hypothetical protein